MESPRSTSMTPLAFVELSSIKVQNLTSGRNHPALFLCLVLFLCSWESIANPKN
jgi:hypothetical protein